MKKTIIGVSGDVTFAKFFASFSNKRSGINEAYISTVSNCNAIPIILPVSKEEYAKDLIDSIDGLILSGGNDVSPNLYGEDPMHLLKNIDPLRDKFEIALLKECIKQNKPVLGICRGMQLINIAFGGTLYQDISYNKDFILQHFQQTEAIYPIHSIKTTKGSIINSILGNSYMVNSIHHQVLKEVSKDFNTTAVSPDGVVETIEKKDCSFTIGVQWHPEIMAKEDKKMKDLFYTFISECEKARL